MEFFINQPLLLGKEPFVSNLISNDEVPLGFASGMLMLIVGVTHHISAPMAIVPTFTC